MTADVLAVGAHPDDVELGVGALICKLGQRGIRVAVLDLTRGEQATRGSAEERLQEAARATAILGVAARENAGLPDGALANTPEQQRRVIPFVRQFRPKLILGHMRGDRHPDHAAAHDLVRDANFFAGLATLDTDQEPYRAPKLLYYRPYYEDVAEPHLVVDVSDQFEIKMKALEAYASQFYNPAYEAPPTPVSSEAFWNAIRARAAYWGSRVGVAYGEPLYADGPLGLDLPPGLEDTA